MKTGCGSFRQFNRREFLRIGGATLCGVSMLDLLRAKADATSRAHARPKQMICVWMAGAAWRKAPPPSKKSFASRRLMK